MEQTAARVEMVWTDSGTAHGGRQTHHVVIGDAERYACGVEAMGDKSSYRTLLEWMLEPLGYQNCKRCAKSRAVAALMESMRPELDAERARLAEKQAKYEAEHAERQVAWEKQQQERRALEPVRKAAPALLAALRGMVRLWDENHPGDACGCVGASDDCPNPPPCDLCVARAALAEAKGDTCEQ